MLISATKKKNVFVRDDVHRSRASLYARASLRSLK